MKEEYDFSKGVKNPYYAKLHKEMTISVDSYLIERLEKIAAENGVSVQRVVNRILYDYTMLEKNGK
ncbi:MAG: antitoxin [Oscillospiraceae bacterium]|nr:antitoxin [Oscillospiraceae bacterium]